MPSPWQIPRKWDIVSCWFPYQDPSMRGPKARPCIVLRVARGKNGDVWVDVVPGTGQNTSSQANQKTAGPLCVEVPADPTGVAGTNLEEVTLFEFELVARLLYDRSFFSQGDRSSPVFGNSGSLSSSFPNPLPHPKPQTSLKPPSQVEITYRRKLRPLAEE